MDSRTYAVFDIDGTIIRWQLYHAIGDALAKQGSIDPKAFEVVKLARMEWKQRNGQEGFDAYEAELIKVFDQALKGLAVESFNRAATNVFNEYKQQVYTYTRDLIKDLKAHNYLLFAISGSPSIIVEKLANFYGFDDFAATVYPEKGGYFTGDKDLTVGRKPELLQALITKHSAIQEGSIGIGDSEGDSDMLSMVESPIAFNPNQKLFAQAQASGWPIVIERKNMIYRLEPKNGTYILA